MAAPVGEGCYKVDLVPAWHAFFCKVLRRQPKHRSNNPVGFLLPGWSIVFLLAHSFLSCCVGIIGVVLLLSVELLPWLLKCSMARNTRGVQGAPGVQKRVSLLFWCCWKEFWIFLSYVWSNKLVQNYDFCKKIQIIKNEGKRNNKIILVFIFSEGTASAVLLFVCMHFILCISR